MRRIRQMSVSAVGELPLPERLRRLKRFFRSFERCAARHREAGIGSQSAVRKSGTRGMVIPVPFRAEYRLREVANLNQSLRVMLWARDPQLLHPVGESRPLEAQASCRSPITSDDPIALAEYPHDLLALGLQQRIATDNCALVRASQDFAQRHSQRGTRR